MDWSCQEVLEFVRLYQSEPAIWDPAHSDYKNRQRVSDAWARIASAMSDRFEVRELKAKKLSLMATYRKLATKVRSCTEEPYKPDWFAYEAMDRFLNGVYEPRAGHVKQERIQEFKIEPDFSAEDDEQMTEEKESEASLDADCNDRIPNLNRYLEVTVDERPSRKRPHPSSSQGNQCLKADKELNLLKSMFERPEQDECSLFGEFLAKKLRALDPETREMAMLELHNTLFQVSRQQRRPSAGHPIANPLNTCPTSSQE